MSLRKEQCNKVCRILDDILANRPNERDSLITAVRKAFDAIDAEPKWIPCSERLPDDEEKEYLITILDREDDVCEVYKGFYQDEKWWTQYCHGCLELDKEPCGDNIVTAWMPLPEAYSGGREDG